MMYCKTNWEETDYINEVDFNRMRSNLALVSGNDLPVKVDTSYVVTAADVYELRSRYEVAADAAGVLAEWPADGGDYPLFDPDQWKTSSTFPRLCWLCLWKGDYNFPAAWELNLYERLCLLISQYSPQQGTIYVGGVPAIMETISIST